MWNQAFFRLTKQILLQNKTQILVQSPKKEILGAVVTNDMENGHRTKDISENFRLDHVCNEISTG